MDFSETANTDGLAHVDVAGDGSGADVEPEIADQKMLKNVVLFEWSQFSADRVRIRGAPYQSMS